MNIFNLGLQEQTTVDELADIVLEEMGLSNVKKSYTGGARGWVGDNPVVYLSTKKIKALGLEAEDLAGRGDPADGEMDVERSRLGSGK